MILICLCVLFFVWGHACTSAVISGKITPDGRPLLWKNRDTDFLQNSVKFFKGEKYSFIGIVNCTVKNPDEVWIGTNSAGFSIMNTQSYNLVKGNINDDDRGRSNGRVLYRALEICANVADFRHFLDTIAKPSGIEANIGVIDAQGGAAMFEVGYHHYKYYDANSVKDAPHGYIARTNFSFSGMKDKGGGYVRYATEDKALLFASNRYVITPAWIFGKLSRSYVNSQLGIDLRSKYYNEPYTKGYFVDQDFIPRHSTACSVVVQGVKVGENPDLTIMWTVLGYPSVSVAFPLFTKNAATLLPSLFTSSSNETVTPFGKTVDALKEKVFDYHQGSGSDKYFNWNILYNTKNNGIMQRLVPVEREVFRRSEFTIDGWRKNGCIDTKEMQHLYANLSHYVTGKYNILFGLDIKE